MLLFYSQFCLFFILQMHLLIHIMNVFYRSECKYKKLCFVNETVEPYLKSGIKNVKSQFLKEIKITWKSDILKTQKPWKSLKPWKLSFRFCLTAKIQNSDLKKPEKYFPRFPSFRAALIIIKKAITYLDKYAWSYFRLPHLLHAWQLELDSVGIFF